MSKRKTKTRTTKRTKSKTVAEKTNKPRRWRPLRVLVALSVAGFTAFSLVGWVCYRQALENVEERLARPLWTLPATVHSGPTPLWTGMKANAAEIAELLQASGYTQQTQVSRPGTFSLKQSRLHVFGLQDETGMLDRRQAYIQFHEDRIQQIDGPSPLVLPGVKMASLGGANENGGDEELRTPRTLDDFPQQFVDAVLAMEDADFWNHPGVSYTGILRALYANIRGRRQGGSTLTQQLAKNLFLTPERTLERKFNELFYALALESTLSKEEILAMYLNEIYWGQANGKAICGAEVAAQTYFGKTVEQLSLAESATLAGIISAPNTYSPLRSPKKAKERRDIALMRMEQTGAITAKQHRQARREPLEVRPAQGARQAPYAVDTILDWTANHLGKESLTNSGMRIESTLHPILQKRAEEAVEASLSELHRTVEDAQMALVAIDPHSGRILALVGGGDYKASSFNRALFARRQLGSTVKPLTMLSVFESEPTLSPATLIEDSPIQRQSVDGLWEPKNYDGRFKGLMSLREAVATSRNIPAVLMAERLGYDSLKDFLHQIGLSRALSLPSTALGAFEASPLEIARAYSLFANGGALPEVRIIDQISVPTHLASQANSTPQWERVFENPSQSDQVVSARAAALARSVLESVLSDGSGRAAGRYGVGPGAGGKTGTTNEARDAWFVGISPSLSVAVWAGRDSGAPLGMSGSKAALPAWSRFMESSGTTTRRFSNPPSVTSAETCLGEWTLGKCNECGLELYSSEHAPQGGCGVRGYFWDLKRRWEPIVNSEIHQQARSNLLPL